jgi:hypothetical protein
LNAEKIKKFTGNEKIRRVGMEKRRRRGRKTAQIKIIRTRARVKKK